MQQEGPNAKESVSNRKGQGAQLVGKTTLDSM